MRWICACSASSSRAMAAPMVSQAFARTAANASFNVAFREVAVIFLTRIFDQLLPWRQAPERARILPGLGVILGIVNRYFVGDVIRIGVLKPLDDVHLIAVRVPDGIESGSPVESDGVHNQGVAVPSGDGVSKPGGFEILGVVAPVQVRHMEPCILF